jgi:hypothetical protein
MTALVRLTRDDISGIHRILVLDKAEAIHELHLSDLPGAMGRKVSLDIGLGSCSEGKKKARQWEGTRAQEQELSWMDVWTCAREVAQVEASSRDLGHVAVGEVG